MHDHIESALDVMNRHLGGPSGYDGRWRIVASSTGESVVIFLQLDEPENRLSLHVESRICPLKFAVVTSVEQLDGLMKHLLSLCR